MTISYTGDVANASKFGIFSKILIKWRGSVYKLVYKELLAYIVMYMIINLTYRIVLIPNSECTISETEPSCERWKKHREMFETLRLYINQNLTSVPLIFVLGFYVSLIVKRWWDQYELLPWPDSMAMVLCGLFRVDNDDKGRMLRRTTIRYIILSYCIALRTVSFRLKKRFPTLQSLVDCGVMRPDELMQFQKLDLKVTANKWFLPLVWAGKMIGNGVEEGNIQPPNAWSVMKEVGKVKRNLTTILTYDWISVPLVYTQVVTLAVYFYFMASLFGSQWVKPATDEVHKKIYKSTVRMDLFYPFFLTLQFAFYLGWLKVAETLINPFGEDDDDFELNRLIDRHIQVGYLIADPTVEKPDLMKDKFWDNIIPTELLYTKAAMVDSNPEFKGSAEVTLDIAGSDREYTGLYTPVGGFYRNRVRSSSETIYESIRPRKSSRKSSSRKSSSKSSVHRKRTISQRMIEMREMSRSPNRKKDSGGSYVSNHHGGTTNTVATVHTSSSSPHPRRTPPSPPPPNPRIPENIPNNCRLSDIEMRETYSVV